MKLSFRFYCQSFPCFLDFQSCATTFPFGPIAYLILGAIGAGTGYYIGDHFYGGNLTDFMKTLNDSSIIGTYNESIGHDDLTPSIRARRDANLAPLSFQTGQDDNIVNDNTLDCVLIGFGVTIVLAIMAFVVFKVRKSQRYRSDYI